jgi:hypothetical protein
MGSLDVLKKYDQAIVDFVKFTLLPKWTGLTDSQGSDLSLENRVIFSSPERPYASGGSPQEIGELLSTGSAADILAAAVLAETKEDISRVIQTLATPVISVSRGSLGYAMYRNNTNVVRKVFPWDSRKKFTYRSIYPRPWDIPYQIDIHCRYRSDANACLHWYLVKPDPVLHISINFDYPWFEQKIGILFSKIIDNSLLQTGERERWIRHSIPITVQGWAFECFENDYDMPAYGNHDPTRDLVVKYRNALSINVENYLILDDGTSILVDTDTVDEGASDL